MKRYPWVLLFCFMSFLSLSVVASDDDDDKNELNPTQIINGQVVIHLDEESQEISGLKTQVFKTIELQQELTSFGKAISISPLQSILNKYLTVSAKQANAKARLASTEKTIARLRNLHKNKAVSSQKLQQKQSQWLSDKTIYDEMVFQSKQIISDSRFQWGKTLTLWSTGRYSADFDKLKLGHSSLLIINLPAGSPPLNKVKTIFISPKGDRKTAFKAYLISLLPNIDQFSQGLQYSFITENPSIKPGVNVTAWIPKQQNSLTGIVVPESAMAWHLGQSFVFLKIDDEQFIHQNITNPIKVSEGYFITEQLTDNEEVVVTGTQMLLSHEFRSQIPDEDDD